MALFDNQGRGPHISNKVLSLVLAATAGIVVLGMALGMTAFAERTASKPSAEYDILGAPPAGEVSAGAGNKTPGTAEYSVKKSHYAVPAVILRDMNGRDIGLDKLLAEDRPVILQFIFATCTTICPLLSATMSAAQESLSRVNADYRMISITIDPEHDTPAKLREYASRNGARPGWLFLTGANKDILRTIKAFGAYYLGDNKMYHQPYTFLRGKPGTAWVRLTGFPSDAELVGEFRKVSSTVEVGSRQ